MANFHVIRVVHYPFDHIFQHCISGYYWIHFGSHIFLLWNKTYFIELLFDSNFLTFRNRISCLKPRYFLSKRYKSLVTWVFSNSILTVDIPANLLIFSLSILINKINSVKTFLKNLTLFTTKNLNHNISSHLKSIEIPYKLALKN